MKRLYSHSNSLFVYNIKNILENNGIECRLKNDLMSSAAGEAPPTETWPEIWVVRERDYDTAEKLIDESINGDPSATSWFCNQCSETNPPAFELCWKCNSERSSA